MKTYQEELFYRNLERKLKAKHDGSNVDWARYGANLLGLGGKTPEQVFRNKFNDPLKRFNKEQLEILHNDLDNVEDVKPFTQCTMQKEIMEIMARIGKISENMAKHFDNKDEIELSEIRPCMRDIRELEALATRLNQRAIETKAQL